MLSLHYESLRLIVDPVLTTLRFWLAIPQTSEYSTRLNSPPRVFEPAAEPQ